MFKSVFQTFARLAGHRYEHASRKEARLFSLRLNDRHRALAQKVRSTVGKIEEGCYGKCESCEQPIGYRSLLAQPMTDLCIECKID